ncbi:MAG: hypothetical protein LBR79_00490 [Oscillospiraceae bacterium]|nr:hypothetical protein [Oscillospiraceae bacterium]
MKKVNGPPRRRRGKQEKRRCCLCSLTTADVGKNKKLLFEKVFTVDLPVNFTDCNQNR